MISRRRSHLRFTFLMAILVFAGLLIGEEAKGASRKRDATPDTVAIKPQSVIQVVYVGAYDCPPCIAWKNQSKPEWIASPEFAQVTYSEVNAPSLKDPTYEPAWTAELRWLVTENYFDKGVPRFLLIVDRSVVANGYGTGSWQEIVSSVKLLIARRDESGLKK